jgi:hypothetical protein
VLHPWPEALNGRWEHGCDYGQKTALRG